METEDRISVLPDEILCHILSFLSTHEAIATSLLSKRWKPLWLSVPILDLDEQTFIRKGKSYSLFFNFAFGALLSHNSQQPLKFARFWLDRHVCGNYIKFPYSLFKIWVNVVVQRGVEHLHIQTPRSVLVSSTILSCKTLVVLKLYRSRINFLGMVHLPALKTLHLELFFILEARYLAEVLHGCPILEDLRVHYVFVDNKLSVAEFQIMPKLVRANMNVYFAIGLPLKVVSNVEYLKFYLEREKECFPMFYNLVHLELHLCFDIQWDLVFEMFDHCPKLQNLGLRMPMAALPCKNWICPKFVPECISSHLRKCTILNYNGRKSEQEFAKYILQNSRALQTMTIDDVDGNHSSYHTNKLEMLQELAMFPKSSTTCRLLFK